MSSSSVIPSGEHLGPLASLYRELRHALVVGNLSEAESVGQSLQALLSEQENHSKDELSDNQLHREVMFTLLRAINAILSRDNQSGLAELKTLPDDILLKDSMLWVARFWTAVAHRNAGSIAQARLVMKDALKLAERLDPRDHATSLNTLAEIEHQTGNLDDAHAYLEEALGLSEAIRDRRGQATARLAQARIQATQGHAEQAALTAHNALVLDPSWPDPVVFLARQSMLEGKLKKAERILGYLQRLEPPPPELDSELGLLEVLRSKKVTPQALGEFLRLEDALPSDSVVRKMQTLVEESPSFPHLREKLAWKLLHLGRVKEAEVHFRLLAEQELDMDMRSSVRLGLGTAAAQSGPARRPGHRLRAAVSSVPPSLRGKPDAHSKPTRVLPAVELPAPEPHSMEAAPPPMVLEAEPSVIIAEAPDQAEPIPSNQIPSDQRKTMPMPPEEQYKVVLEAAPPPPPHEDRQSASSGPSKARSAIDALDGRKAVFKGGLQHLGVPELLQFFHSSRMTGTLLISAEQGLGAVHFDEGMIAGAAAPACSNLGDLLKADGVVTAAELETASQAQLTEENSRLLGAILVEDGRVDAQTMRAALEKQVFLAIGEMMDWRDGQFAFAPVAAGEPFPSELELCLDPQMVLLDVLGGD